MKLLRFSFDHLFMFEDGMFELDLFAEDRVPANDESVFRLDGNLYANNTIAFAGINASGKSMSLALTDMALDLVAGAIINDPLDDGYRINLFDDKTTFRGIIWVSGELFLLETYITIKDTPLSVSKGRKTFSIVEETIYKLPSKLTRKELKATLADIPEKGALVMTRSSEDKLTAKLLGDDRSIFLRYSDTSTLSVLLPAVEMHFSISDNLESASDLMRVFDSSIKSMDKTDESDTVALSIEGRSEPLRLSLTQLENVLSSGTIKGYAVAQFILEAIRDGSYLLIDEIENHLNKTLVQMIVELFSNSETNPHGATLIFTTHYPEILDCIHRKDCVYFLVRNERGKIEVVKYSERVGRIENKKSEVFISNFIKGTAPKYSVVSFFQELAKSVANDDE